MATVQKLINVKPITPHPYRLNPSCGNCGAEAEFDVLIDNGDLMVNQKLCKECTDNAFPR